MNPAARESPLIREGRRRRRRCLRLRAREETSLGGRARPLVESSRLGSQAARSPARCLKEPTPRNTAAERSNDGEESRRIRALRMLQFRFPAMVPRLVPYSRSEYPSLWLRNNRTTRARNKETVEFLVCVSCRLISEKNFHTRCTKLSSVLKKKYVQLTEGVAHAVRVTLIKYKV